MVGRLNPPRVGSELEATSTGTLHFIREVTAVIDTVALPVGINTLAVVAMKALYNHKQRNIQWFTHQIKIETLFSSNDLIDLVVIRFPANPILIGIGMFFNSADYSFTHFVKILEHTD